MLSEETVACVLEMLDRGHSHAKIARVLEIARGTVRAIARGTWAPKTGNEVVRRRLATASARRTGIPLPSKSPEGEPEGSESEELPEPVRCPHCGGLVYAPCRLCNTREIVALHRRLGIPLSILDTEEEDDGEEFFGESCEEAATPISHEASRPESERLSRMASSRRARSSRSPHAA